MKYAVYNIQKLLLSKESVFGILLREWKRERELQSYTINGEIL